VHANLAGLLRHISQLLSLTIGSIQSLLDQDTTGKAASTVLQPLLHIMLERVVQQASWEGKEMRNPLSVIGSAPRLRHALLWDDDEDDNDDDDNIGAPDRNGTGTGGSSTLNASPSKLKQRPRHYTTRQYEMSEEYRQHMIDSSPCILAASALCDTVILHNRQVVVGAVVMYQGVVLWSTVSTVDTNAISSLVSSLGALGWPITIKKPRSNNNKTSTTTTRTTTTTTTTTTASSSSSPSPSPSRSRSRFYNTTAASHLQSSSVMTDEELLVCSSEEAAILSPEGWQHLPGGLIVSSPTLNSSGSSSNGGGGGGGAFKGASVHLPSLSYSTSSNSTNNEQQQQQQQQQQLLFVAVAKSLLVGIILHHNAPLTPDFQGSLLTDMTAPAQELSNALQAKLRSGHRGEAGHLPGYRYCVVPSTTGADNNSSSSGGGGAEVTPRSKISAMTHHARSVAAALRDSLTLLEEREGGEVEEVFVRSAQECWAGAAAGKGGRRVVVVREKADKSLDEASRSIRKFSGKVL